MNVPPFEDEARNSLLELLYKLSTKSLKYSDAVVALERDEVDGEIINHIKRGAEELVKKLEGNIVSIISEGVMEQVGEGRGLTIEDIFEENLAKKRAIVGAKQASQNNPILGAIEIPINLSELKKDGLSSDNVVGLVLERIAVLIDHDAEYLKEIKPISEMIFYVDDVTRTFKHQIKR